MAEPRTDPTLENPCDAPRLRICWSASGLETVAHWFAAIGTVTYQGIEPRQMRAELTWINGGPGVVLRGPDRVIATLTFDFDPEGRISAIYNVANPDKLHAVAEGTRHDIS